MLRTSLFVLAATIGVPATAQVCSDNTYALHLVTAAGVPLPTGFDPVVNATTYLAPNENVYLAFDPTLPSGTYYVHVTDNPIDGFDEVLSANDPLDRFVTVTNNGGVISLSLPFTNNQSPPLFGLGLNGVGQSILLAPLSTPTFSVCRFKAWYGNSWDLTNGPNNPYLLVGGLHPTLGGCAVRSYHGFRIGDGNGSDVTGVVFLDTDHDGLRDPGESGFANQQVRLVTGSSSVATLTDGNGAYRFENVAPGGYTVELTVPSNYIVTTAATHEIQVCGCANVAIEDFGLATQLLPCNARTIGYWRNNQGLQLIQQFNILPTLPALFLVNSSGQYVAPATITQWKNWLKGANAWNMAYMLSAQLAAMHCNVIVGYVHADCVIDDPSLGTLTIAQLMQQAVASLGLHPYTPVGSPFRDAQSLLKNALDRANNNSIWQ